METSVSRDLEVIGERLNTETERRGEVEGDTGIRQVSRSETHSHLR